MLLLTVENLPGAAVAVPKGTTLLAALQAAGFDWMHACGMKGRCTTCRLRVRSGAALLAPDTEAEARYRAAGRLQADERLTCQARPAAAGEVRGVVPEATKLPHVRYE